MNQERGEKGNRGQDRSSEDSDSYEYLKKMPLQDVRIWMRYRPMAIKGVKANCKASHADLSAVCAIRTNKRPRNTWKYAQGASTRGGD